jgi:hypothetical protein
MITTFYAPVYMLSQLLFNAAKQRRSTKCNIKPTFPAIFVGVSQQILKLHASFGMVLPVPKAMEKAIFPLYYLLIPSNSVVLPDAIWRSEKDAYNDIQWLQRSDVKHVPPRKQGWSNFPAMLWIIGFLLHNKLVVAKFGYQDKESIDSCTASDFAPLFQIGMEYKDLSSIVYTLLFHASNLDKKEPELQELRKTLKENLSVISKAHIYSGLKNAFDAYSNMVFREKDCSVGVVSGLYKTRSITRVNNKGPAEKNDTKESTPDHNDNTSKTVSNKKTGASANGETLKIEAGKKATSKKPTKSKKKRKRAPRGKSKKGKTAKKRKETDNAVVMEETQPDAMEESYNDEPTVPKYHMDLPPDCIDLSSASWYWTYSDILGNTSWPAIVSADDVIRRMHFNTLRLMYNLIAVEYAIAMDTISGDALFRLLSIPANATENDELVWDDVMKLLETVWQQWKDGMRTITRPSIKPLPAETLLGYFGRALENMVEASSNSGVWETPGRYSFLWKRSQVVDMSLFGLDTVCNDIHKLKCCLLYDTICFEFFKNGEPEDLTDALFLSNNSIKKSVTQKTTDWTHDFNLLIYHLPVIQPFHVIAGLIQVGMQEGTFFDVLVYITRVMQSDIPSFDQTDSMIQPFTTPAVALPLIAQSRPSFYEAKLEENVHLLNKLKRLFFLKGGYMRRDIRNNLFYDYPHGLIQFGGYKTSDVRWFLTLQTVDTDNSSKWCNKWFAVYN